MLVPMRHTELETQGTVNSIPAAGYIKTISCIAAWHTKDLFIQFYSMKNGKPVNIALIKIFA